MKPETKKLAVKLVAALIAALATIFGFSGIDSDRAAVEIVEGADAVIQIYDAAAQPVTQ